MQSSKEAQMCWARGERLEITVIFHCALLTRKQSFVYTGWVASCALFFGSPDTPNTRHPWVDRCEPGQTYGDRLATFRSAKFRCPWDEDPRIATRANACK